MREENDALARAGIRPFGLNPAPVADHRAYAEKFGFPFPLLSDEGHRVARAYRALKQSGVRTLSRFVPGLVPPGIQRTVYLVGRDGRILFAQRGAPPVSAILAAHEQGQG